jgi:hypothetical protein
MLAGAGCSAPGDAEAELREWLARGEAAVSREDRRELLSMVSPSYADARGNARDDIDKLLRFLFLRQDDIRLVTRVEDIVIHAGTAADISLTAAMAGSNDSLFGMSAEAVRFELELERRGDDWELTAARWGELGEALR